LRPETPSKRVVRKSIPAIFVTLFTWLSRYCVQKATSKGKEKHGKCVGVTSHKKKISPTPQQAPNTTAPTCSEIETLMPSNRGLRRAWAASSSKCCAAAQKMANVKGRYLQ